MMFLDEYQEFVDKTARFKDKFTYACLGLAGETGEVIEQVKKLYRDHDLKVTPEIRDNVKLELGDVLWYLTRLASEFDLTLDEVAEANIKKLEYRDKYGKKTA